MYTGSLSLKCRAIWANYIVELFVLAGWSTEPQQVALVKAASELLVLADPVNYVLLVALVQAASKLLVQADLSKTGERRLPDAGFGFRSYKRTLVIVPAFTNFVIVHFTACKKRTFGLWNDSWIMIDKYEAQQANQMILQTQK